MPELSSIGRRLARRMVQNRGAIALNQLAPDEIRFLDVFLYEATTAPFTGPATKTLHNIGVEYGDISYVAWAYEQEVPGLALRWRTSPTSFQRRLGRTDRRHCGGTRKSGEFGSSDNSEARARWGRAKVSETGTWQTKWALKAIQENGSLGKSWQQSGSTARATATPLHGQLPAGRVQSATFNPGTLPKSERFLLSSVASCVRTMAAIFRSIAVLSPRRFRPERLTPLASESHGFLEGGVVGEASRDFLPPGTLFPTGRTQLRLELGHLGFQGCDSLFQVDGLHGHSPFLALSFSLLFRQRFCGSTARPRPCSTRIPTIPISVGHPSAVPRWRAGRYLSPSSRDAQLVMPNEIDRSKQILFDLQSYRA